MKIEVSNLNVRGQRMVELKVDKGLCFEGFQYGSGDIATPANRGVLHLYEVRDSEAIYENCTQENFRHSKENNFLNVHGITI